MIITVCSNKLELYCPAVFYQTIEKRNKRSSLDVTPSKCMPPP